ncbi:MAG: SCO family protein [Nitrospirae bacterium]|nr:SCO family protein [Nitrospirota bacterium]
MLLVAFHSEATGHEDLSPGASRDIGVIERTGQRIALDAEFYDEQGNLRTLKQLLNKPVVLSLVYYGCDRFCPLLLSAVADVTSKLQFVPGKEYELITISFDPEDNPGRAREAKKNYIRLVGGTFPPEAWSFMSGTSENISKVLDSVGFAVIKDELHGFSHPAALVVLSADGKIIRYVYTEGDNFFSSRKRVEFQPFDLSLAIGDAAKGRTGLSISRVLAYCFPHQPKGQAAFFNILKIAGGIIVFLILSFFIYLTLSGRMRKAREQ